MPTKEELEKITDPETRKIITTLNEEKTQAELKAQKLENDVKELNTRNKELLEINTIYYGKIITGSGSISDNSKKDEPKTPEKVSDNILNALAKKAIERK